MTECGQHHVEFILMCPKCNADLQAELRSLCDKLEKAEAQSEDVESRKPSASVEQEAREWVDAEHKRAEDADEEIYTIDLGLKAYLAGHASGEDKGRELAGMVIAYDKDIDSLNPSEESGVMFADIAAKAREVKGEK